MTRRTAIREAALLPLTRWPEAAATLTFAPVAYDWASCDLALKRRFWWIDWVVRPLQTRTQCFSDRCFDRMQAMTARWELDRMRQSGLFPSLGR